jgi:putative transcriptional regulator
MNAVRAIRQRLGVTQAEVAEALGVTQGNVSFIERGQEIQPEAARRLIAMARDRGLAIGMDHVYGLIELPQTQPAPAAGGA